MSEAIELTRQNIQDIRNRLGAKAFLVTAPRLTLVVEKDGEKTAYSLGDSIDLERFEEKPEQEEVKPQGTRPGRWIDDILAGTYERIGTDGRSFA